jgi:penicillin-binding protein 1A
VLPPDIAATETSVLETVLQYGTARSAAIGQFAAGKTGTTSNYGDAWFVGWDSKYTVAVWVGYPNSLVPMTTQFDGGPVLGGTFPALIWHDFMISALHIDKSRAEQAAAQAAARASGAKAHGQSTQSTTTSPAEETATPQAGEEAATERHASPNAGGGEHSSSPAAPVPSSPPAPAAPSPSESAPAPKGGGGANSEATGGVSASP